MSFSMFLKIAGVDGESMNKKFDKWITVESFSFGVENAAPTGGATGAGAGKVKFNEFHFVSPVQVSSPKLMTACVTGQHFKDATLNILRGNDATPFIKFRLTDVLVTSFSTSGHSGDALPRDSFSLNFAQFEEDKSTRSPTGAIGEPVQAMFDIARLNVP